MKIGLLDRLAATATALALVAAGSGAFAQNANPPPEKYGPPIGDERTPEQQAQPAPDQDSDSLSHRLSGSGGVVQPPPTGDRGVITPPSAGPHAMPVIPPPNVPDSTPK